jgi:hypothetical protein
MKRGLEEEWKHSDEQAGVRARMVLVGILANNTKLHNHSELHILGESVPTHRTNFVH